MSSFDLNETSEMSTRTSTGVESTEGICAEAKCKKTDEIDAWDALLNVEDNIFAEGMVSALEDLGLDDPDSPFHDGCSTGFAKGYAFFMEIAFYEAAIESLKTSEGKKSNSKYLGLLEKRLQKVPKTNVPNFDFITELSSIRSLYKLSGEPLGEFVFAKKADSKSHQW